MQRLKYLYRDVMSYVESKIASSVNVLSSSDDFYFYFQEHHGDFVRGRKFPVNRSVYKLYINHTDI